ncbi:Phenylalanine--tRNA ligase beta subunit [Fundidesulfovibrio magnetotacticus]|uniref:Phenylalanine--tRNA ligase beta subunit n=1 Tax=Fundidesulfovibrio magnetotacticus TaxID=2730080 RepID=A0A6V8LZ17_9BACT|nr:phenylalanine--tRNA ligase subunit beta [Fundidesulfovibrio magnetotacticus]GFK95259.1 Phenylalanine--tRNA ligase beta subunit [Fundidesulfovibrio magnetotacticus]
MLLSLNWLREFVPYEGPVDTLADRLTMLGLEVEGVSRPFAACADVVVGKVLTREQHPDADKLSVCSVDVGQGEPLQIVCGAANVAAGQFVPVATIGTKLPGGLVIKKSKLRGVESCGMICSESELGLAEKSEGILALEGAPVPGKTLAEAFGLDDVVLEIGITPNRADCLSILGLARETAMAFGLPLSMPKVRLEEHGPDASSLVRVDIQDPSGCPVYRARIIQGVEIKPSPAWMRWRLAAMGQRPLNNIVDVTNYVMLELGQPLHAFDRSLLAGDVIEVRRARDGQRFTTLDGQERTLTARDLLICDQAKAVALAGVMGGENSEINDRSTDVLLECAVFDPATIRKTGRRLGLSSESSYRYERGVDQPASLFAMNRAAALMAAHSDGRVLPGVASHEPRPWKAPALSFRPAKAAALLGIELTGEFCRKTLQGLGCEVEARSSEAWSVVPPPARLDLEREVDLVEEVARVYGMDRIPAVMPRMAKSLDVQDALGAEVPFLRRLRDWAVGAGLRETVNYSFVGQHELDLLGLPGEGRVPVANPLSEDQNVMRPSLAPGLLKSVRHNLNQGNAALRLFEIAKIFVADKASETTVRETDHLAIALHGARFGGFPWPEEKADYSDLKGLVEHLLGSLGLHGARFARKADHSWLSPCVEVSLEGRTLGVLGRVLPDVAASFEARADLWLAELDAQALMRRHQRRAVRHAALPKFPPSRRDVTLVTPAGLSVAELLKAALDARPAILEDVAVHDLFEPKGAVEKNVTLRATYRHAERTLTDKDVDKAHQALCAALGKALPVRLQQ